jgi:hypothetical protein
VSRATPESLRRRTAQRPTERGPAAARLAWRRVGGRVAPIVRERDLSRSARRKAARAALGGLVLLGACLNPRPEETPSSSQLDPAIPGSSDRLEPNAQPSGEPERNVADPSAASPAPNAPTPAPELAPAAPELPDAGGSDAGAAAPADAG